MNRKPVHGVLRFVHRGLHAMHVRTYETYQPVTVDGRQAGGSRECAIRWNAVQSELDRWQCRSLVDLGCSEGYYVLQAARRGVDFCVGVDFDLRRIWTCQNQVVLEDLPNAAFLVAEIRPAWIEAMPTFDAVVFLSVLHHLLAARGEDFVRTVLRALSGKVGKVMVFEMGQSDERSERWSARLPDMGADPHAWIATLLVSCGFRSVDKIAEAPSYGRTVSRAIFACRPTR